MPDTSELSRNILHYQKSLDRYAQTGNDVKILYCISKLNNMPITISHLEETGIGRTVNSLRKMEGDVGDAAKTLVAKWKDMVTGNDEDESEHNNSTESDNSYKIENKSSSESNSSHKDSDRPQINGERDSKHKSSKGEKYNKHDSGRTLETKLQSSSSSQHKSISTSKEAMYQKTSESESGLDSEENTPNSSQQSSESEEKDSSSESERESRYNKYENDRRSNHKHSNYKENSTSKQSKYKQEADEKPQHRSQSNERTKKHDDKKYSSSSSSHKETRKDYSSSSSKSSSKRKHETNDDEPDRKVAKKSSHDSHRSSTSSKSKEAASREHKKESKYDSDKKDSKNSSKSDTHSDKRKRDSKDNRSRSDEKNKKESSSKSESSSSKNKSKSRHSSKSSNSSGNSSSSKKDIEKHVDIGSESGTSFADALGMLEPTSSRVNKKSKSSDSYKQENKQEKVDKAEKKLKESKEKFVIEKPLKEDKVQVMIPPPPPQKVDIDISSLLPTITPNYRPVANPFVDSMNSKNKIWNDDEALSSVLSQKNQRTKVFSGNKSFFGNVPKLFDLCIRVLEDNIDALEYTGGVPYEILKPILDKATPEQLFILEHHNPYLIEDTDEIWHFHCQQKFRNKKREELESWREMYMRCLDEREVKLKTLTANIRQSQDRSAPVRKTQLAYVESHSVVKPPRDVLRKQAKSGFDKKPIVTPSARLTALVTAAAPGQVSVPNPVRASSSGSSSAAMKPKKAPLMQKTLALLKGSRFRR